MTPQPTGIVLTTEQNWAARSHRELYDAVHIGNDPGKTGELGWHWEQFGAQLTDSAQVIAEGITATESGWTGASADAARAALRQLAQWVTETARNATDLSAKVHEQSRIMATARAAMPEPVEFDWDATTGTLSGPGIASLAASAADVQAANEKARAAHEQAVRVMTEMERQSRAVDEATPHFTAPFNPTTGRTENLRSAPPATEGAQPMASAVESAQRDTETSETRSQRGYLTPEGDAAQQVLAASASVPSGQNSPELTHPPKQVHFADQGHHLSGLGGAVAAAGAAGAGAYAGHAGGRPADDRDTQTKTAGSGRPSGASPAPGSDPALGPVPPSGGQQQSHEDTPHRQGGTHQGFGSSGGGLPSAAAARAGGAGGFSGMPGKGKGKSRDDADVKLPPGKLAGAAKIVDGQEPTGSFAPNASGVVGAHPETPASGAVPPGAGMARSPGEDDTEHKTAYVQSEDIFDVPGDDLPPSVIGGRGSKKGGSHS